MDFRPMISLSTIGTTRQVLIVGPCAIKLARGRRCNNYEAHLYRTVSALPTLLLTIKRHLHILRHAKHHWQIPLRAEKSPRCDRTPMIRGFLASYFEFVDCNFIKEPRPNVAKGHERVFLRTLLSNFPTICNRQRIADSIAGFLVDRYVAFKRCTWRGPNKSLVIYPHPFPNFTRIDLGHGSGRAHSKGRHNGRRCGVEFQSNHFPNWLVTLPSH